MLPYRYAGEFRIVGIQCFNQVSAATRPPVWVPLSFRSTHVPSWPSSQLFGVTKPNIGVVDGLDRSRTRWLVGAGVPLLCRNPSGTSLALQRA